MTLADKVKTVPIIDYAMRIGFTPVRKGKYYSLKEHDSVMISARTNRFWRNSSRELSGKGVSYSIIDFAMEFGGACDVKDAIWKIAQMYNIERDKEPTLPQPGSVPVPERPRRSPGNVELPEPDGDNRAVYGYLLNVRKIDISVVRYFIMKNMLYQDKHQNCVFHTGTTFGCLRGTSKNVGKRFVLDLEGCDYNECFYFRGSKESNTLIVTESVIDAMSVMTYFMRLGKRYSDYCYLALAGAASKMDSVFYHIKKEREMGRPFECVLIATDIDDKGEIAAELIAEGLDALGVENERFVPPEGTWQGKDWNEYIVATARPPVNK